MIITILSNTFTQYAYAANDIDHDAMLQYNGYGQAMYESIVEQSTFITGQYTDNQEYVKQSINQVKDYANFWSNERQGLENACGGLDLLTMNCLGTMTEKGGAYFLTVGDWIKNLFNDYGDEYHPAGEIDYSIYNDYVTLQSGTKNNYRVNQGYKILVGDGTKLSSFTNGDGYKQYGAAGSWQSLSDVENANAQLSFSVGGVTFGKRTEFRGQEVLDLYNFSSNGNFGAVISLASKFGVSIMIERLSDGQTINPNPSAVPHDYDRMRDYINNNSLPTVVVPQLKPQLVCPNGSKIDMNISGSTFLAVDGTVMMVEKDGTAQLNGEICNLNWQKPTVDYDPNGNPVLTDPDGTETNLNTGDTTTKPPDSTDLEGCTGVLCGIGKLLDGVGSVVKAIGDLVKKLLDGLLGLFVPEDLDFVTEEFNKITKKLNDKIAITDSLKEAITGVFDGGGSNPLANISINLPITNEPLTFGNVSFIEEGVPILRRVISAIVVLYTIAYVYRKITGRGGVMER